MGCINRTKPFPKQDRNIEQILGIVLRKDISQYKLKQIRDILNQKAPKRSIRGQKLIQIYSKCKILDDIFIYVQSIEVEQYYLELRWNMCIIKEISDINFPRLKKISLCNNSISNVEELLNTKMSNLQILDLSWNRIVNVNILNKLDYIRLSILWINNNIIMKLDRLQRMDMHGMGQMRLDGNRISEMRRIYYKSNNKNNLFVKHQQRLIKSSIIKFRQQYRRYSQKIKFIQQ